MSRRSSATACPSYKEVDDEHEFSSDTGSEYEESTGGDASADDSAAAAPRPSARRQQSAPTGTHCETQESGTSSAANVRVASRSRSAVSAAATAAGSAPAPLTMRRERPLRQRGGAAQAARASASQDDDDDADDDDEADEEDDESSSSDEDGMQQQCASLKKKVAGAPTAACKRKSLATQDCEQERCGVSKKRKKPRNNKCSGGSEEEAEGEATAQSVKQRRRVGRSSRHPDPAVVAEEKQRMQGVVANADGISLLAEYHRMRALYEAPVDNFDDVIAATAAHSAALDGLTAGKKRKSKKNAADIAGAAAGELAAAAAVAVPMDEGEDTVAVPLLDFATRVPFDACREIMNFLPPSQVARLERVCVRWRDMIRHQATWKGFWSRVFPLVKQLKESAMRRQDSGLDAAEVLKSRDPTSFFQSEHRDRLTVWAARRTEGKANPIFDPAANDPLGSVPADAHGASVEQLLKPSEGVFNWKYTFVNRLAASCVECRRLTLDVYKLTRTRVCLECALHHPTNKYDVVNSGCAKGKFVLSDAELACLPAVVEFDVVDDHKTIFHNLLMVRALAHRKHGGDAAFRRMWQERVEAAHVRLESRKERGLVSSGKKKIPIVYRDNVGSTPEKTKGFFLCGRHNLATLYARQPPPRIYPEASLE